ncbi:MAG: phage baseplate protein, partial [Burkholderiales bacterium 12-64-5]
MIEEIDRRIAVAMARVRHALRATLSRLITSGPVALVQADALSGEQLQAAELMQHYGFTSAPPAGALLLVVPVGGRTAHGVVVADEHAAFRIRNLPQGEVAIYTDEGDHIRLKRGRVVEISTQTLNVIATTAVNITTPTLTVTAAAAVNLTTPT